MDLISKEELKDYLEKNISFGGTEKKFKFYDMIDSLPSAFEGMTNGKVFMSIFPSAVDEEEAKWFFGLMWWNSPYKGGE